MAITALLSIVPLVAIILIFSVLKNNREEDGGNLVRNLYVYLVLFATLMMVIGGSIGIFTSIADIVAPAPYHQSFEDYVKWGNDGEKFENKTEEQLKVSYEAMIEREVELEKHRAINTLIKSFGWIVIPLPVFIFFQRRLTKG